METVTTRIEESRFFCNFITAFKSELIYNNMSINKVILVGNVGKDPVVRYFDKGVAKAAFPLATSETYTNQQGETITSTEWHNIVLWRALAEVAEKTVKKGSQLYIVGKIKTRSYVDKDGNNKYITEILGDTMVLLEKKTGPAIANQSHDSDYRESGGTKVSNDPVRPANPPSGSTAGDHVENSGSAYASDKHDNTFDEGIPGGKNEDDLPF
jgi:single-strand DNA-binding protein